MFQVELICSDPRCTEELTLWVDDLDEVASVASVACECGHGWVTVRAEGFEPVFAAVQSLLTLGYLRGVIGPLRTGFELALRGSRVPLDLTLQVTGRRDSVHELRLDRAEAGVRTVVGTLLGDDELRELGIRGLTVATERESAAREAADAEGWTT